MLVDTHCHLVFPQFEGDAQEVIERARAGGVTRMIVPGTSVETSRRAIELAKRYPRVVYAGVGIHPEQVQAPVNPKSKILNSKQIQNSNDQISKLRRLIRENREWVVAIGETGMDRKQMANGQWQMASEGEMEAQKQLFRVQCELALEYDLPVIIHTRASMRETLEVLDQLPQMPRGQFHCWSDGEEELEEVLARGFYVGFCGNVTYKKNDKLRELAERVPSNRLLLETDSPYLPPQGRRGERNEPINVRITASVIAEVRGIKLEELEEQTTENVERLFGI